MEAVGGVGEMTIEWRHPLLEDVENECCGGCFTTFTIQSCSCGNDRAVAISDEVEDL